MSNTWQDEYKQMIDDCNNRQDSLTDWEEGFISSLDTQLERGKTLTPKQAEKLSLVWERCTSKG